jgi:hypothetical protein
VRACVGFFAPQTEAVAGQNDALVDLASRNRGLSTLADSASQEASARAAALHAQAQSYGSAAAAHARPAVAEDEAGGDDYEPEPAALETRKEVLRKSLAIEAQKNSFFDDDSDGEPAEAAAKAKAAAMPPPVVLKKSSGLSKLFGASSLEGSEVSEPDGDVSGRRSTASSWELRSGDNPVGHNSSSSSSGSGPNSPVATPLPVLPQAGPPRGSGTSSPLTAGSGRALLAEHVLVAPPVDDALLQAMCNMAFPELQVRKALLAGCAEPDGVVDWILAHANDAGIDDPIPQVPASANDKNKVTLSI